MDNMVQNLGQTDGPLLVFGGPYSNIRALRAVRDRAKANGIAPENCICTGDVVAYGGEPMETVAEIGDWGCRVLMGNCEQRLGNGENDCGCGFAEGSACDTLSKEWFEFASRRLDAGARKWMRELPRRIELGAGNARLAVVHGGVSSISRFIFASTPEHILADELTKAAVDGILAGHCGLPFTRTVGGQLWHNAGAIGMPANDGQTGTWYSVITPRQDGGLAISRHRLDYEHAAAAARMRAAGLADGYARAMESGLWPSLDVLPANERERTGQAIVPTSFSWRPKVLL